MTTGKVILIVVLTNVAMGLLVTVLGAVAGVAAFKRESSA